MEKTSQIEDYLYLGGWWSATRTKAYGIKVILSILDSPIPDECRKDGIEYLSVIADDDESVDLLTHFPQTNQWISQCVESKRPILVHCMAGMSRSPTIVCAYVMQKYKKSTKEAIEWVRKKRSIIDPNEGFETQLELYHQMGYTLDAKNRNFRNFLFMSYLGTHNQSHSVRKYLELMTIARDLTGDVPLGRQYSCVKCSTPAFHEINIIRNDRLFVEHDCDDMYIEPMEWMLEEIEGMAPDKKEGRLHCRQCSETLATFKQMITGHESYNLGCRMYDHCHVHSGLDTDMAKIKVINEAVNILEPLGNFELEDGRRQEEVSL